MELNFASPAVAHVTWLNPTERFELLLRREIRRIETSWFRSGLKNKKLNRRKK
jgi:hypothetical protein